MQNEAGGKNGWNKAEWIGRLREEIEPWPEPVDGEALLDELAATVQRVVVISKWAVEAIGLWILHTYAFELRDITTYLGIESPQHRCGKSTLLDFLGLVVKRPVRAANISPPAFFRTIQEERPALLVDETDTFLYSQELRGILNAGYQRAGAYVIRVSSEVSNCGTEVEKGEAGVNGKGNGGGSASRRVKFSCWCPKAIARIGCLPQTLADRCIVIVMQRKLPSEKCGRLREVDAETLRRKCARFAMDHAEGLRAAKPVIPEGLNDRAADIIDIDRNLLFGAWSVLYAPRVMSGLPVAGPQGPADSLTAALRQSGVPDSIARMAGLPGSSPQGAGLPGMGGVPGMNPFDPTAGMQGLTAQSSVPGGSPLTGGGTLAERTKQANEQAMEVIAQQMRPPDTMKPAFALPYQVVPASVAAKNPMVQNPMPFGGSLNSPMNSPLTASPQSIIPASTNRSDVP